ncbi:MAG: Hsp20/alpha crystallin family protein [Dehalococcoidia bacterium]
MRTLIRWVPVRGMTPMRRAMDRLFDDVWTPTIWHERHHAFPVDLYETDESVVAKAALPGVNPDEVDVSVNDDLLTIKGEKKEENKDEGEHYVHREFTYGVFCRTVQLPASVDSEKATAEYEDGVLTITLPKHEGERARTIKVQSK